MNKYSTARGKELAGSRLTTTAAVTDGANDDDLLNISAMLNTLWRGKIWIALFAALGLVAGWYEASRVAEPQYQATAQLALQFENSPVSGIDAAFTGVSGDEYSMNTEMVVITSREMVGRLVDQLGLTNDPEFNSALATPRPISLLKLPRLGLSKLKSLVRPTSGGEADVEEQRDPTDEKEELRRGVINAVRGHISAETQDWSYIFSISATSNDQRKAALLANTMAEIYRQDQIDVKVAETESAAIWLSEQVADLALELEDRARQAAELRSRNALVSDAGVSAVNTRFVDLRTQLQVSQNQADRLNGQLAMVEAATDGSLTDKNDVTNDAQLQALLDSALTGDAIAIDRFNLRFDQVLSRLRSESVRANERVAEIQKALDDLRAEFDTQSADLQALQQIERETEATRVLYQTFLTRLKETTVQIGIHQADSRILSEATPGRQIAPKRSMIMGGWLFFGLLLGTAIVVIREFSNNTFRDSDALERQTGRAVLGEIPLVPSRKRIQAIDYLRTKPTSAAAEAVRNLRTSILLSNVDTPPQVIMLTSSVPGEGKTTQSIALAMNLAGLDRKILLVEGDIRRKTFASYFKSDHQSVGLCAVVMGEAKLADTVFRPEGMNFDVLAADQPKVNAADLFASERFADMIKEMRDNYDYIVIDSPPVLAVPDARVIAQYVDATVYSVHWDKTTKAQVAAGLRQFESVDAPICGMVLSRVDARKMRKYSYGGKYGGYGGYGGETNPYYSN